MSLTTEPIPDFLLVANRKQPYVAPYQQNKPLVWSYTMLDQYEKCGYAAYRRYVVKDIPFKETPQMRRGNEVHSAMEYRVSGRKPLPADMHGYEKYAAAFDRLNGTGVKVEYKLGIDVSGKPADFFAPNVFGRGKIDVSVVNGDRAYILDWKTGSSKYEKAFELEVGAMLLHTRHPGLKEISGQYAWLVEDRLSIKYDLSDTTRTWNSIGAIMRNVQADLQNDTFEKKRGPLCAWCPVFSCEHNKHPDNK